MTGSVSPGRRWAMAGTASFLLIVSGCFRPPAVREEKVIPNVAPSVAPPSENILKVAKVTGGEEPIAGIFSLPENVRIPNQALYQGLYDTLVKAKLFKAVVTTGECDYELVAEIASQQIHQRGFLTYSVGLLVKYVLVDKREQMIVLTEHIFSEGTATARATNAARNAAEDALRGNIASFLTKLSSFPQSHPEMISHP